MFKVGDAVVHPVRGAGTIVEIETRRCDDEDQVYYRIELLGQPTTRLMLPVEVAEALGLRRAVSSARIDEVWQVFDRQPEMLPSDNNERYDVVKERLRAGDVFQVAQVVRDMAWRERGDRGLTTVGKRLYTESVQLLAAEIAAANGVPMETAEIEVKGKLRQLLPSE
jgi:CarD family transcriptional regulator